MTRIRILIPALLLGFTACNSDFQSFTNDTPDPSEQPETPDTELDGLNRVTTGIQAFYRFNAGAGSVVADISGAQPAANLTIQDLGAVEWMPGGGLNIVSPTILSTAGPTARMGQACMNSNAITMEAWVRPAAVNQTGPARIFTYSIDNNNANFMLGQNNALAEVRVRTSETDNNGTPATVSAIPAFDGAVVHVAYTRSGLDDVATVYVNGNVAGDEALAGDFANWDMEYQLAVANELNLERPWRGEIYLAAMYCRALTPTEIFQNYSAGY